MTKSPRTVPGTTEATDGRQGTLVAIPHPPPSTLPDNLYLHVMSVPLNFLSNKLLGKLSCCDVAALHHSNPQSTRVTKFPHGFEREPQHAERKKTTESVLLSEAYAPFHSGTFENRGFARSDVGALRLLIKMGATATKTLFYLGGARNAKYDLIKRNSLTRENNHAYFLHKWCLPLKYLESSNGMHCPPKVEDVGCPEHPYGDVGLSLRDWRLNAAARFLSERVWDLTQPAPVRKSSKKYYLFPTVSNVRVERVWWGRRKRGSTLRDGGVAGGEGEYARGGDSDDASGVPWNTLVNFPPHSPRTR